MRKYITKLTILFFVINIVLLYFIYLQINNIEKSNRVNNNGTNVIENNDSLKTSNMKINVPKIENYSEISNRPLFSKNRKPTKENDIDKKQITNENQDRYRQKPLNNHYLIGVVLTEGDQFAYILDANQKKVKKLRINDKYNGWTVSDIDDKSLVLQSSRDTIELVLWKNQLDIRADDISEQKDDTNDSQSINDGRYDLNKEVLTDNYMNNKI